MKQIFSIIILAMLIGCADQNCNDQMAEKKAAHGPAEEINTYHSGDYHNIDWWYWSRGFQFSFTWGENVEGCQVSQYSFTPIGGLSMTVADRINSQRSKVLVDTYFCFGTRMPTR